MSNFEIYILGCGSALPTTRHHLSCQVVKNGHKLYMIDCGEGAQLQFRRLKLNFNRLDQIFISHLHGDHFYGLPGLISTLGLLGRKKDLFVYAPAGMKEFLTPILSNFNKDLPYPVHINEFDTTANTLLWEDKLLTVESIPLKHRVPTGGFLFREKPKDRHLIPGMIRFYTIPVSRLSEIKKGADYTTEEGQTIPNSRLTRPSQPPKSYAYCSDTAFYPPIASVVKGVDLLYHEATFMEKDRVRAEQTFHSTARQAAEIARMSSVGKLLLGHFSARYEDENWLKNEAKEVFPNTHLAHECHKIEV